MMTNQTDLPEVDGFVFDPCGNIYENNADFRHPGAVPDEYTEEMLDVYLTPVFSDPPTQQDIMDFNQTVIVFETSAERNFDGEEDADYSVTCDHPPIIEKDKPFKIESRVLRGTTPIDHATVVARVSISTESDPNAEMPPMFFELSDVEENDGTYTIQLTPDDLHIDDGLGISVMCNLVESSGGKWNDNNFYGKMENMD